MFFLYVLAGLTVITLLLFAVPLRAKAWTALVLTGVGALWASIRAVGVLAGATPEVLWRVPGSPLGGDSGSLDSLSALFVVLISIGAVASVLYSRGYLAHTLNTKSPAHVSLHYT